MRRSMMQVYVNNSKAAVEVYKQAFNARVGDYIENPQQLNELYHAELDVYGQCLAVSGPNDQAVTGSTMQFCLHFAPEERHLVERAYEVLQEGALRIYGPEPTDWAEMMVDITDRFGVRWCLFA